MREDSDNMFWLLDYIINQFYLETLPRSKLFFVSDFRSLLRIQESQNCLEKENETLDELIGGKVHQLKISLKTFSNTEILRFDFFFSL